jgi:hypothetical protein
MVQGGIFLRKMPPGIEDSVKTRIETAVAAIKRPANGWAPIICGQDEAAGTFRRTAISLFINRLHALLKVDMD